MTAFLSPHSWIDLIRGFIRDVCAMVILRSIVVDFVQLLVEDLCRMTRSRRTNLSGYLP